MAHGVLPGGLPTAARCTDDEDLTLRQIELGTFAVAKSNRSLDHLIEYRLEPFSTSDCPEHVADCALLRKQVSDLARKLSSVVGCPLHPDNSDASDLWVDHGAPNLAGCPQPRDLVQGEGGGFARVCGNVP